MSWHAQGFPLTQFGQAAAPDSRNFHVMAPFQQVHPHQPHFHGIPVMEGNPVGPGIGSPFPGHLMARHPPVPGLAQPGPTFDRQAVDQNSRATRVVRVTPVHKMHRVGPPRCAILPNTPLDLRRLNGHAGGLNRRHSDRFKDSQPDRSAAL